MSSHRLLVRLALALLLAAPAWAADKGFTAGTPTEESTGSGSPSANADGAKAKPGFAVDKGEQKSGGGWSDMMRSVTGFLGRPGGAPTEQPGATATIGIRGLSAAQLGSAQPNYNQVTQLDQQAVSQGEATSFAQSGKLQPQRVEFLNPPGQSR